MRGARKKTAHYGGVSFIYDASLASEVKAETRPGEVMREEDDVKEPTPEHVAFTFTSADQSRHASFVPAEIHVYNVADYRRAVAASKTMTKKLDETIGRLKSLLRRRPVRFKGEVPTLPPPDGFYAFRAHTKYLAFKNGRGIAFLTQGQQEEMPVNNQRLSYLFQGITNDGLYYVTAEFPASAPVLPDDDASARYEGFGPPRCLVCPAADVFKIKYRAYAESVGRRLDRVPPERFRPDLRLFEELLRSLEVRRSTQASAAAEH